MKQRLLYITADYPPRVGGQSRLSGYLVQTLRTQFEVAVYLQQPVPSPEPGVMTLLNTSSTPWFSRWVNKAKKGRYLLRALSLAYLAGTSFDLVVAGDSEKSSWVGGFYCFLFRKKRFYTLAHGRDFSWSEQRGFRGWLNRALLRRSVLTIANSQETARRLVQKKLAQQVQVVHPPVSKARFQKERLDGTSFRAWSESFKGTPVILTLSRLVPRKGVDLVLRALSQVKTDFVYVIAGEGPDRAKLEALAQDLGLAQKVVFLGQVDEAWVPLLYSACSFFVLCPFEIDQGPRSDFEGFGMVYLEANASGKPVIATRSGGVEDAVKDNFSGLIVPPQNVEHIKNALNQLLSEPETLARLSVTSQKWADQFEQAVQGSKYLKLLGDFESCNPQTPAAPQTQAKTQDPFFAVIISVKDPESEQLLKTLESLMNQTYTQWRAFILQDLPTMGSHPELHQAIQKFYRTPQSVFLISGPENQSNAAIQALSQSFSSAPIKISLTPGEILKEHTFQRLVENIPEGFPRDLPRELEIPMEFFSQSGPPIAPLWTQAPIKFGAPMSGDTVWFEKLSIEHGRILARGEIKSTRPLKSMLFDGVACDSALLQKCPENPLAYTFSVSQPTPLVNPDPSLISFCFEELVP